MREAPVASSLSAVLACLPVRRVCIYHGKQYPGQLDVMVAMPIQAPSRGGYGGRDASASPGPLPPISTGHGETLPRPFGPPNRNIPFSSNLSPSAASAPMKIRGMEQDNVPPPLPPPRLVPIDGPVDPKLHLKESMRRDGYGTPETDSLGHSFRRPDPSFKSDFSDDGYHSLDSLSTRFASPLPPPSPKWILPICSTLVSL